MIAPPRRRKPSTTSGAGPAFHGEDAKVRTSRPLRPRWLVRSAHGGSAARSGLVEAGGSSTACAASGLPALAADGGRLPAGQSPQALSEPAGKPAPDPPGDIRDAGARLDADRSRPAA